MKTLAIHHIGILGTGEVEATFHKLSSDGDALGKHVVIFEPGDDINVRIGVEDDQTTKDGFAPISSADTTMIAGYCKLAWTKAVVKKWTDAKKAAEEARAAEMAEADRLASTV